MSYEFMVNPTLAGRSHSIAIDRAHLREVTTDEVGTKG
jgi:hypothetical protein